MFGLGSVEIGILVILTGLAVYPMYRIALRLGYSVGASIAWGLALTFLALPASWILAFSRWPRDDATLRSPKDVREADDQG